MFVREFYINRFHRLQEVSFARRFIIYITLLYIFLAIANLLNGRTRIDETLHSCIQTEDEHEGGYSKGDRSREIGQGRYVKGDR